MRIQSISQRPPGVALMNNTWEKPGPLTLGLCPVSFLHILSLRAWHHGLRLFSRYEAQMTLGAWSALRVQGRTNSKATCSFNTLAFKEKKATAYVHIGILWFLGKTKTISKWHCEAAVNSRFHILLSLWQGRENSWLAQWPWGPDGSSVFTY